MICWYVRWMKDLLLPVLPPAQGEVAADREGGEEEIEEGREVGRGPPPPPGSAGWDMAAMVAAMSETWARDQDSL